MYRRSTLISVEYCIFKPREESSQLDQCDLAVSLQLVSLIRINFCAQQHCSKCSKKSTLDLALLAIPNNIPQGGQGRGTLLNMALVAE